MEETILILDFGSQYTQLIARRVRELNVYCEIHPFNKVPEINEHVKGVILSGSPYSVRGNDVPDPDLSLFRKIVPTLGVCYGAQLMAQQDGGNVAPSAVREYGRANLAYISEESELMKGMSNGSQVWMSHGDTILDLPEGFEVITSTHDVKVAGFKIEEKKHMAFSFILKFIIQLKVCNFTQELCRRYLWMQSIVDSGLFY